MVISHSKKFIFIHNYKVAGTSMRQALKKYHDQSFLRSPLSHKLKLMLGIYPSIYSNQFDGHITANELKSKLPSEIFENYFKFGFVRNPWDWQVSLYTYMLKDEGHYQHEFIKSLGSFENYLQWRVEKELRLQKRFFYDSEDNLLVDYVGKIETIGDDLDKISEKLGLDIQLPHLKKSRKDSSFRQYYTQETIDLVNEAFADDIQAFGYKKPEL